MSIRLWFCGVVAMVLAMGCGDGVKSSEKQLGSFSFQSAMNQQLTADVAAMIDGAAVTATVPFGTDVRALVGTFGTSGARVTVGGVQQVSGVSRNDFTAPVTYRVEAADGSTADYTVEVTVDRPAAKELSALSFRDADNADLSTDVAAVVSGTSITATVPFGTRVTALVATFSTTGDRVTIGAAPQLSGVTANDFTSPLVYRVTAQNGSTQDFTVTVVVAKNPAKALTALSFRATLNPGLPADVIATIDDTSATATVPFGTNLTALVATFSMTGASVRVGSTVQTSGVTPNNFTSPVTYRVVAEDDSVRDYTVTFAVAMAPKELLALSFASANNPGLSANVTATINGTVVAAVVPSSVDLTALVATFATTGASVTVGGAAQTSGITPNDFTSPLVYRVTGLDGLTRDYTVTVTRRSVALASNADPGDQLGDNVALSADGSTLAVAAAFEASAATGVNGDQTDNSVFAAGAVYVFARSGTTWVQQAYLKASNTGDGDRFGYSLALSHDGSTLAVGSLFEDSAATGIDGDQADDSALYAGAVYVFARSGTTWSQQAYVKASNTEGDDAFGNSVALSADGSILAVGAYGEDSSATGVNGNQLSNSEPGSGAVYLFARSGAVWAQQFYLKASNGGGSFGSSVALSADASTLAVGAHAEDSAATGVGGNQNNTGASLAGAVYVFAYNGVTWSQQAYIKASNTNAVDFFGRQLALSHDGSTLATSAPGEDSAALGVGGNQASNAATESGAVYVFHRVGTTWAQQAYVKASNTGADDDFGRRIALSGDGSTLAVGAPWEDSAAIDIGGNQADNSLSAAGAVYVLKRSGSTWSHRSYVKAPAPPDSGTFGGFGFGMSVALSGDGATLAVGAPFKDVTTGNDGAVFLFH